jgi:hypothetical protein
MVGRKILGIVVATLMLLSISAIVVEKFRHSVGPYREVEGTIRSAASVSIPGNSLRGASAVVTTVELASGAIVQASVVNNVPVFAGSQVTLREYPQNFGSPRYEVAAPAARREP